MGGVTKKNSNCDNVRYGGEEILAPADGIAVGRRSGTRLAITLLDHYFHHSWHERSALQSVAVRRRLATTLVATIAKLSSNFQPS